MQSADTLATDECNGEDLLANIPAGVEESWPPQPRQGLVGHWEERYDARELDALCTRLESQLSEFSANFRRLKVAIYNIIYI